MEADGDHFFEKRERRLNVRDAIFFGPRSVFRNVEHSGDSNGEILVPGDGPVFLRRFIKENTANWDEIRGENF